MNFNTSSTSRTTIALATAATGIAITYQLWTWVKNRQRKANLANYKKIKLLPNEIAPMICKAPSTSTITYFKGNVSDAVTYFTKRTNEIVAANPWLGGVLDIDENGRMAVFVPPADIQNSKSLFSVQQITLPNDYNSMVESLGPTLLGTSEEAVGTDAPLWKVSLIPDGENKFALVVSANHSLLDGYGYYKIYNMLSNKGNVQALSPQRKHELPSKILTAMGDEPSLMAEAPPGFLFRYIGGVIRNAIFRETKSFGFNVSQEWIMSQKKKKSNEVLFVSTNDVLFSHFVMF